jgi:hypothetical protein
VFELLKTIGSFVGLLTGAVTVYDRLAKGRPIATITYEKATLIRSSKLRSITLVIRRP